MTTTKRQALKEFKYVWQNYLSMYRTIRSDDKIAKRECWSNFIDSLNKEGEVTDEQAATWTNPF
jgi:hypothetical protein